jgi:hypothetical protein
MKKLIFVVYAVGWEALIEQLYKKEEKKEAHGQT